VTAYSLRAQLGGRGEPRRLMAVWQQIQPHRDAAPADQPQALAAPPSRHRPRGTAVATRPRRAGGDPA
jgi:hypothetical protein